MRIAISGAGIAGPTLAWWLARDGHEITLIEKAESFRTGGYVIDFWGVGYDVAEKMGLLSSIREAGYQIDRVSCVGDDGREQAKIPVSALSKPLKGRFTSIARGDLAEIIFRALGPGIDTRFGTELTGAREDGDRMQCSLASGEELEVDMLVGADGLHSRVRGLVFGEEARFAKDLGYRVAAFRTKGYRPRDEDVYVSYTKPGRSVSRFSMRDDETLFLFIFAAGLMPGAMPEGDEAVRILLREVFGDLAWETRQILDVMDETENIYFDTVSQIHMPTWSKGRTVLVGDAAACISLLGGEGTGLAMAEAYVLAGELKRAGGDVEAAFAAYEQRLSGFLAGKQKSAPRTASYFAPKSSFGLMVRNLVIHLMGLPLVTDLALGSAVKDRIDLPDY